MKLTLITVLLLIPTLSFSEAKFKIKREHVVPLSKSMQIEIAGLHYKLNPFQLKHFFSLKEHSERRAWIDRYWLSQDPTPATAVNEMRDEHTLRVRIARDLYKIEQWPGWDRRGEVSIRYGSPNVRTKIHAEVTARKTHAPGEMWYYGRHGMLVVFRDESLTGNYIYAINALGATQDMTPDMAEFLIYDADTPLYSMVPEEYMQFYRDPEIDPDSVDPNWNRLKTLLYGAMQTRSVRPRVDRTSERWDDDLGNNVDEELPVGGPADMFHMEKIEKLATNFQTTLDNTPSAYPFNFDRNPLKIFFDIGQFKGGDDVNRVEVNMEIPIEPTTDDEAGATREYTATAVFWNNDFEEIARKETRLTIPVLAEGEEERLWPAQLVFSLERNYYRMAVTVGELRAMIVEHPDSGRSVKAARRSASYRSNVTSRDFQSDLSISDILFAQRIGPTDKPSPFIRGAVEVVPHPIRRYKRGTELPLYFEVYSLSTDEDGLSSFEVEYRIVRHSPKKKRFWDRFDNEPAAASSRFKSSGYGDSEPIYVTVKTENLRAGTYDFLITIEDEQSQSVTFRRATFRIVED